LAPLTSDHRAGHRRRIPGRRRRVRPGWPGPALQSCTRRHRPARGAVASV